MSQRKHLFWFLDDARPSVAELDQILTETPSLRCEKGKGGQGLLTTLAALGLVECVAFALRRGCSPDGVDGEVVGPLVSAVEISLSWPTDSNIGKQIALLLLSRGACIHRGGGSGDALRAAVLFSNVLMAELLMEFGAKVDSADGDGYSALHLAVSKQHVEMVKLLIDRGANPRLRTLITLKTPLDMVDSAAPKSDELKLLLRQGWQ